MNTYYILAIDPSLTNTGYAVFKNGAELVDYGVIKTKKANKFTQDTRLLTIINKITKLIKVYKFDYLAIETQFLMGFRGASVLKVAEVSGAIKAKFLELTSNGVIFEITPSEAKKDLGVKGVKKRDERKALILKKVNEIYAKDITNLDISDAIAIGYSANKKIKAKNF